MVIAMNLIRRKIVSFLTEAVQEQIKALGIEVKGQEVRPLVGALSVETLSESMSDVLELFGKKVLPQFENLLGRVRIKC